MPEIGDLPISRRAELPVILVALLVVLAVAGAAAAETGLPLPRFVSLAADRANVRAGPGTRYPIRWVFVRRGLPLEIVAEYELWRKIRDQDGAVGWIHKNLLSGRRMVLIQGVGLQSLHASPSLQGAVLLRAEPGVIASLIECAADRCRIEVGGRRGWLDRSMIWGVEPNEFAD